MGHCYLFAMERCVIESSFNVVKLLLLKATNRVLALKRYILILPKHENYRRKCSREIVSDYLGKSHRNKHKAGYKLQNDTNFFYFIYQDIGRNTVLF